MRYTVKQLAKISGVSVRTLHWYDQIGLLKPAYIGANNYRYYEQEQLLLLQQILFFRELNFSLNDIEKLLRQNDFNKIEALKAHRIVLTEQIDRKNELIDTINKTISRLEGEITMTDSELYYGFDSDKQRDYERYLASKSSAAEGLIKESKKNTAKWSKKEWNNIKTESDEIYKALAILINQSYDPASQEVQQLINRHFNLIKLFYYPTKEVYIGLSKLYLEHSDFKRFYDAYHPTMVEYIGEAMRIYAEKNLS